LALWAESRSGIRPETAIVYSIFIDPGKFFHFGEWGVKAPVPWGAGIVVVLVGGVIVAGKTTVLVSVSPVRRSGIEKDGRASGSHDRILNATPDT
jgi:hypothetical protein